MTMRLRLYGADHYNGDSGAWRRGDVRDVAEQEALRLLATFPQWFERAEDVPQKPGEADSPSPVIRIVDSPPASKPFWKKGK